MVRGHNPEIGLKPDVRIARRWDTHTLDNLQLYTSKTLIKAFTHLVFLPICSRCRLSLACGCPRQVSSATGKNVLKPWCRRVLHLWIRSGVFLVALQGRTPAPHSSAALPALQRRTPGPDILSSKIFCHLLPNSLSGLDWPEPKPGCFRIRVGL
jgi:hypothetical protein